MSMTDEGTRTSNQPAATKKPDSAQTRENGAGQPGGGLPGLAAFGQMQGYTPVSRHQHQDEHADPAPQFEPEPETETAGYDQTYEQDYSQQSGDDGSEFPGQQVQFFGGEASAFDAPGEEDIPADFNSDGLQSYAGGQHASYEETETVPATETAPADDGFHSGGGFETGDGFESDAAGYGSGNSLQAFEARYDQHPEIPLGVFEEPGNSQGEQPFFHEPGQSGDAEFLSGTSAAEAAEPKERRGRKVLMAASGLIGVLALGGALAFAYKIGGDSDIARAGKPPLIQADNRPVKVAPEKPGGKEFPHANKKIYERLGGDKSEEVVTLQPREEDVAAAATAAIGDPATAASLESTQSTDPATGAPRKVRTLTVRPDGTIEAPDPKQPAVTAPPPSAVTAAPDGTIAMSFPQPSAQPQRPAQPAAAPPPVAPTIPQQAAAAPVQQQAAASQAPGIAAPPPVQKPPAPQAAAEPAPQQTASAPAAAPASDSSYVVQVAARKNQTDALAAFADIQQKYPQLLKGYRPIIQRADLGDKGVWYRLNVGPVESKQVASNLCGQLKNSGMRNCIVREQ